MSGFKIQFKEFGHDLVMAVSFSDEHHLLHDVVSSL